MPETSNTPSLPYLTVRIRHRIGTLELDVQFNLTHPWTVLFGPSGSGKSTILRIIAGLIRPDHGRIVSTVDPGTSEQQASVLLDTEAGIFVPPHRRGIPLAAQQPSLFPHLTVLENLRYGLSETAADNGHQNARGQHVQRLLDAFRIADLASRHPHMLSGGQAQRVVLARTAAAGASRLMLLDEPFNGLELALQDELIAEMRRDRSTGTPRKILSVTHDIAETFQLDADIIRLSDGRITAQGPPDQVLRVDCDRLMRNLQPQRSGI